MTTSNTRECFSEFVGQKVVGVLFAALPLSDAGLASGTKSLVFEDGRALTIAGNGSFWVDSFGDVSRAICRQQARLEATQAELADVLELAGVRAAKEGEGR